MVAVSLEAGPAVCQARKGGLQGGEDQYVDESRPSLRRLLSQRGSYPMIAAQRASGGLSHFPVALFLSHPALHLTARRRSPPGCATGGERSSPPRTRRS